MNNSLLTTVVYSQFQEALLLFESILYLSWFKRASIILLFTNLDIFEEKTKIRPISDYFPDYDGTDDDSDAALEFPASRFLRLAQKGDKRVEIRFIETTHAKQFQIFLRSVEETVKKRPLRSMVKALQLEWSLDDFTQEFSNKLPKANHDFSNFLPPTSYSLILVLSILAITTSDFGRCLDVWTPVSNFIDVLARLVLHSLWIFLTSDPPRWFSLTTFSNTTPERCEFLY